MKNLSLSIKQQKYIIISSLLSINIALSVLATLYRNVWYLFIIILGSASFISSINVILIFFQLRIILVLMLEILMHI